MLQVVAENTGWFVVVRFVKEFAWGPLGPCHQSRRPVVIPVLLGNPPPPVALLISGISSL